MTTEDEVGGPLLATLHTLQSSQVHPPYVCHKQSKFSHLSPIPWDSVTSKSTTAQSVARVRDQDGRLGPVGMGNMQSWEQRGEH